MNNKARKLDQFYTDDQISIKCLNILKDKIPYLINGKTFLEPSAGTGSFIRALDTVIEDYDLLAYDIDPKHPLVLKENFLELDLKEHTNLITIGNPPFGTRARLAIDFLNKSMEYSDVVAFILPVQFNKWGTQRRINKDFKLIVNERLEDESFIFEDKRYAVRSTFQVWVRKNLDTPKLKDMRLKKAPPTNHKDFEMWQYNNTKGALKFFDYDWDFAVPRQGYKDYTDRYYDKDELIKTTQYIFFKAKNPEVLERLLNLDFVELSLLNTSTPGFGKADVVSMYSDLYDNKKEVKK